MDHQVDFAVNTLTSVSTLVLVALGLAIIFGMMGVINMAHGEFVMIGAFTAVTVVEHGVPLVLAIPISAAVTGLFGIVVERTVIRYLYGKRIEGTLLATFGLSLILQQAAVLTLGTSRRGISTPLGSFKVGQFAIGYYQLVLIAATVLMLALVLTIFLKTQYGLAARATMQNRQMAGSLGINTDRVNTVTFGLGSATAGAAGALIAPTVAVVPAMGVPLVSSAFMTVVVGGPASVSGTAAAGGLLGLVRETTTYIWTPVIGTMALLVAAIVILRIFPDGISSRWRRTL